MLFEPCLLLIIFYAFTSCSDIAATVPLSPDYHAEPIQRPQAVPSITSPIPLHHTATQIEHRFIDDFSCDADSDINGWSNCNQIQSKYHGPFTSINRNTMYRKFQCDASCTSAMISFSIVYDCNVAFTDTVFLYVNNNTLSQYNCATQQGILNDPALSSISDCEWYVDRNITYTMPIIDSLQSFEIKFETIFKVNIDKNIAIFGIAIDCITAPPITIERQSIHMHMIRDDVLKCNRYYKNSNSKSSIGSLYTMNNNLITFSLQYSDARIIAELALSHFNGEDLLKNTYTNEWYWSIQIELSKKQIVLQNKSADTVIQTIFPLRFRIKDEEECYLDITNAFDVFWNCDTDDNIAIWSYDNELKRLFDIDLIEYLKWNNDTIASVTSFNDSDLLYMISANEFRYNSYKIAYNEASLCQLTKDTNADTFIQMDGPIVNGYGAIFRCDGNGVNIKLEIEEWIDIEANDWADLWITSVGRDNIKIGIGQSIGNEDDVVFAYQYKERVSYDLQCGWIATSPLYFTSNWRFYDYSNSSICDVELMDEYNITQDVFNHEDAYSLYGTKVKYLPYYLWSNPYLMFEVSSIAETWMQFKMKTGNSIVIEFGKSNNIRGICESKAEDDSYYIVMNEYICSEYSDYELSEPWLFWMQWIAHDVLQIGNGAIIGQSIITTYDDMFNAVDIESISIGCGDNQVCEWSFYAQEQQLVLLNTMFAPQSKLLFTYYHDNTAIFYENTSINIYSYSLNIDYELFINFKDANGCVLCNRKQNNCVECAYDDIGGIALDVPHYYHIAMHKTFDSEYEILLDSSTLLLKHSKFLIKRTNFMNITMGFMNDMIIDETLKVSLLAINNDEITQNTSYIQLKSTQLGIDAVLCMNYVLNTCLICDKTVVNHHKDCKSCYDGIALGSDYIEKRMQDIAFPQQYTLSIASTDTILTKNKYKVTVRNCAIGSGLMMDYKDEETIRYKCSPCPQHSLNLFENDNECHSCLNAKYINMGYDCQASNILIHENHWLTISTNSSFQIISSICPLSYCCRNKNGCFYNESEQLCALNRDPSIPLCGGCLRGYAEIYGGTHCMKCTADHYGYVVILLGIALLYVIAISFVIQDTEEEEHHKQSFECITQEMENFKCSALIVNDSIDALVISVFHCIAYFYQSIAYILINYSMANKLHFIMPFLQIFSMDLSINTGGFCFLSQLDALSKELWLFALPFSLFIAIFIIWIFIHCGAQSLFTYYNMKYRPNFTGMLWCCALLSWSTILSGLFRVLSCRQVGAATIHFIAPQYECFDEIWYFALIAILLMMVLWSVMLFINYRYSCVSSSSYMTNPYKSDGWYWEYVILSRRLWISALVTFKYLNEDEFNIILGILFIFCIGIHLRCQPFKYNRINNMETLCLFLLLCCFVVINVSTNDVITGVVIIPSLIFPILLFISRVYCTIKLFVSINPQELNQHQQKILLNAINRLPRSRRDIIVAIIHKRMPYIKIPHKSMQPHHEQFIQSKDNTKLISTEEEDTTTKNTYIVTEMDSDHDMILKTIVVPAAATITDFTKTDLTKTREFVVTSTEDRTGILLSEPTSHSVFVRMSNSSNGKERICDSLRSEIECIAVQPNENEHLLSTMAVGSRTDTQTSKSSFNVSHDRDCKIKHFEPKFSYSQSGDDTDHQKWMDFQDTLNHYPFQIQPRSKSSYSMDEIIIKTKLNVDP